MPGLQHLWASSFCAIGLNGNQFSQKRLSGALEKELPVSTRVARSAVALDAQLKGLARAKSKTRTESEQLVATQVDKP